MAIALVQSTGNRLTTTVSAITATFASPTTTGNLIVVAVVGFIPSGAAQVSAVSDNFGNVYKLASFGAIAGVQFQGVYYCENATGGASHVVTATNVTGGYLTIGIGEFSGMGASVAHRGFKSSAGSSLTPSTGSVTIGATSDVLIALASDNNWTRTYTKDAGFVAIFEATGTAALPPISFVYQTGLSGNTAAGWTLNTSTNWLACAASLKQIASGGGTYAYAS